MRGLHELDEARPDYDTAWAYWRAKQPEQFDSPVWQRVLAKSQGSYRVNMAAKVPIVALADRLKISSMVGLSAAGDRDDETDRVFQDRVWVPNKLQLQTKRLIRNTLIYGDAYWHIWRGDDEGSCQINYNSPQTTRAVYDDDNELQMMYVIRRWKHQDRVRASILYADRLELGWVLKKDGDSKDLKSWIREKPEPGPDGKPLEIDVENPYKRPPVFHFRTDMPYGVPEGLDAYGAQDAINKLTSVIAHTGERAGLPDRYLLTDPSSALTGDSADSPDWDDDGDADETSRDNSRLRSGPGEVSVLAGIRAAGEWGAPDLAGFMGPADWFASGAAKVTRTPARYADPGGQHPSGAALRAADAPLDAKTEDRQDYLTDELKAAGSFALLVCGLEDRRVDVRWKPAGIVDDLDTWHIVAAKQSAGVPTEIALVETGLYEPDTVRAWLADSTPDMDVARRIGLLSQFAGAVAQLGQGVAMGLLDETAARTIVDSTISQLTPEGADTPPVGEPSAQDVTEKAQALGQLVWAGVDPAAAAEQAGLDLSKADFTGEPPSSPRRDTRARRQ
jgi:hypothetical protein